MTNEKKHEYKNLRNLWISKVFVLREPELL